MSVMTAQPPLPLAPESARCIGAAAAIIEDDDGGRVFVHGNLIYAWDDGDTAGRRFAAVSLVRIKAATQVEIAEAFAVKPATVRRWDTQLTDVGVAGLLGERKGPKRKSKLTDDTIAEIRRLRADGLSYRGVAARIGVSEGSARNALKSTDTDGTAGADTDNGCASARSDESDSPESESELESVDESGISCAAPSSDEQVALPVAGLPVLADPVSRVGERVLARFGLLGCAPPVFHPCARAPLAGLLLGLPALAATGLLEDAHSVYGELPNGFYSLDAMLCEGVFRALLGVSRAEGATRIDPVTLGRVLGLDRAPEVKTIRRKIRLLADAHKAGDWIAAMAHRHVAGHPEQAAVFYVDGHVRAYQGARTIGKTHLARLRFPAPATTETWVSDAAGDPGPGRDGHPRRLPGR